MMTNLFSMFDPSSSLFSLNWIMFFTPIIIFPLSSMFIFKNNYLIKMISMKIQTEIKSMMENSKKNSSLKILLSIFMFIFIMNIMSMFPYNFTITSQISFSLSSALILWLSFLILGWLKNTKSMMAHLLPIGTPPMLMPIMVLIEITSQIIRPITLSVRLTANMVAGHLLMSLLGTFSLSSNSMTIMCSPLMMMLTFLEICVSMIQAFVFMTLLTLYSTEVN